jgi:hypothetical protein
MLTINDGITVQELDEAIAHIYAMLQDDRYGNRLTHKKKELLRSSIDDLLDARLALKKG